MVPEDKGGVPGSFSVEYVRGGREVKRWNLGGTGTMSAGKQEPKTGEDSVFCKKPVEAF